MGIRRPLAKASDAEFWCVFLSAPEQMVEQTNKTSVIWDADRAHYDVTVLKYVPIRSYIVWLFI